VANNANVHSVKTKATKFLSSGRSAAKQKFNKKLFKLTRYSFNAAVVVESPSTVFYLSFSVPFVYVYVCVCVCVSVCVCVCVCMFHRAHFRWLYLAGRGAGGVRFVREKEIRISLKDKLRSKYSLKTFDVLLLNVMIVKKEKKFCHD